VKAAVQRSPREAGIDLADWNWKVVRQYVGERFRVTLGRSSCLSYLHRLGFVLKRPKKRLLKANPERRAVFVREYALLRATAAETGAKIFFVDEAHFYADVDLRGTWVLKGEPALVGSTSPRYGEKASYYSAVCLETGEVEAMELDGNSCAETSVAFLQHLRARHAEPLIIIWDNGPAHGGDALRAYLATPDVRLRIVRLPAYSPDFNPDEARFRRGDRHCSHNDAEHLRRLRTDPAAWEPYREPPPLGVPVLRVDTSAEYRPTFETIVAFARGRQDRSEASTY
jgi:hypothetical protein